MENTQELSRGLMAMLWREGAGLEMIGGWTGGEKVAVGPVTGGPPPSEPEPNDWMAFPVWEGKAGW